MKRLLGIVDVYQFRDPTGAARRVGVSVTSPAMMLSPRASILVRHEDEYLPARRVLRVHVRDKARELLDARVKPAHDGDSSGARTRRRIFNYRAAS